MKKEQIIQWANQNLISWLNNKDIEKILKNNDLIECINSCTSPRKSKEDGEITEADLKLIFKAFSLFKPDETKVLILGQDPYPDGKGTGFAFLLNQKVTGRDSLYYILKAIKGNKNFQPKEIEKQDNEKILKWVKDNKILLLNTALTHENPNEDTKKTHRKAWKDFIDLVIKKLLEKNNALVIFAWGNDARDCIFRNIKIKDKSKRKKELKVDISDNIKMFYCYHPTPINENNPKIDPNLKCSEAARNQFKECNENLKNNNEIEIDWAGLLNIYTIQK